MSKRRDPQAGLMRTPDFFVKQSSGKKKYYQKTGPRPGVSFWFSGCWRALAKDTAWAGFYCVIHHHHWRSDALRARPRRAGHPGPSPGRTRAPSLLWQWSLVRPDSQIRVFARSPHVHLRSPGSRPSLCRGLNAKSFIKKEVRIKKVTGAGRPNNSQSKHSLN